MSTDTLIEKVREPILRLQKKRAEERVLRKGRKDQFVVLTIDTNGKVLDIHNDWDFKDDAKNVPFKETEPCSFVTPVDKGKSITWIGIPEDREDIVSVENIVLKNSNGRQVLRSRSYIRGNTGVVVGKAKDNSIQVGEKEEYYLTYKVNDKVYVLDPIIEIHDR